jgi:large subunit ribosomal protein L4
MPVVKILNMKGETVGEMELTDAVFGVEPNEALVHAAVVRQMANARQGTANTKTRAFVRGGGRKPWRQKGTGRARQGSRRSPNWVGGGIVFGPHPRSYRQGMPRKARRLAMRVVLSDKVRNGQIYVLDNIAFDEPKTKLMAQMIETLKLPAKTVIITAESNENIIKSGRNIPGLVTLAANTINIYDLLNNNAVVFSQAAIENVEEALKNA